MRTLAIENATAEHQSADPSQSIEAELKAWRNSFGIKQAKAWLQDRSRDKEWTVAVLGSGGCLDTLAAIRSGFTPIWSSETNPAQARMFEDLTGAKCLGDTFGAEVAQAKRPRYLKSGPPCTDYTRAGDELGQDGETGWMFVEQTKVIVTLQPWAFCLEISDNAVNVSTWP